MPRKRTLTPKQEAYEKELKRARNFMRRAEKRGYFFQVELPERPKRVTAKALRELRDATKPAALYKKSLYVVPETGEAVSGTTGRTLERQAAAKKGARKKAKQKAVPTQANTAGFEAVESRILDYFYAQLAFFVNAKGAWMLKEWADRTVETIGKTEVAHAIYMAITAGELFLDSSLYDDEIVRSEIERLNAYLPETAQIPQEAIDESMEGWDTDAEDALYREKGQW